MKEKKVSTIQFIVYAIIGIFILIQVSNSCNRSKYYKGSHSSDPEFNRLGRD